MAIDPVSGSPTRLQYRGILRSALPDRAAYPDYLIDQWIADGVREYSANFPYRTWGLITCDAGVRQYLLNDRLSLNAIVNVIGVEYPTGQTPRRFLSRRDEHGAGFYGSQVYDIGSQNTTVTYLYGTPQLFYIVLGETPAAGEKIWVEYDTVHQIPTADSSVITVPEQHLELVRLYVAWRAAEYIEVAEAVNVDRKDVTSAAALEPGRSVIPGSGKGGASRSNSQNGAGKLDYAGRQWRQGVLMCKSTWPMIRQERARCH